MPRGFEYPLGDTFFTVPRAVAPAMRILVPLAVAVAVALAGCQTHRPDPAAVNDASLWTIENTLPAPRVRYVDPAGRVERALYADRVVQLPGVDEADAARHQQTLDRLEQRFSQWCERESLQPRDETYPYDQATLTRDIESIAGAQLPTDSPLLICMGRNGRTLVGAYVVLTDRRVAFYKADDARRLRRFLARREGGGSAAPAAAR